MHLQNFPFATSDWASIPREEKSTEAVQAFWRTHGGFEMILITTAGQVLYTPGLSEKITPTEGSGYEYVSIHP